MNHAQHNFTIIVNWKEKGFGCAKACSYCNWRTSPFLPHGAHDVGNISAFIRQCRKSFVTISGGADPLYRFDDHKEQLLAMVHTIRAHGFRVRIITREVQHVAKLRCIADLVSVSLDNEVLDALPGYQHLWVGMDIEYSLVLPPIPTEAIIPLKPQYEALRRSLNGRLVLRENLNSIYPINFSKLSFGHRGIVFVRKNTCLDGRYLSTIDSTGHDIMLDHEQLASYLMGEPNVFLFGGFVRHLVNPALHPEYDDIDVIALNSDVIASLSVRFSYSFTAVSPSNSYPRYFLGKSAKAGKTIQLALMYSASDALQFIHNSQYDLGRVGYSAGSFYFDPHIGEQATVQAIHTKRVNRVHGSRAMHLFHAQRPLIEQQHRAKLLRKGFTVLD